MSKNLGVYTALKPAVSSLMLRFRRLYNVLILVLGKHAMTGGQSLNGFEVIQL